MYTVTGEVMASMVLLIKCIKRTFQDEHISQMDDLSYSVCKDLTRILYPLDEEGESFLQISINSNNL